MPITTPDMNLVLPDVSSTIGPLWATYLNAAFVAVDSHDHSTGKGIAITPSGLNISSDLTFNQNNATNLRTLRLFNASSFTGVSSDKGCFYVLNNELHYIDGVGNDIQVTLNGSLNTSVTISSLTLNDSAFVLQYFGDNTRKFRFDASGISTNTTRVLAVPNANDTLVGRNTTDTLTNKTFDSTSTLTGVKIASLTPDGTHTVTMPTATDTLVGKATTDTLINKILTGNTISSFTPDGGTHTLTAPAITDTLVTRTNTETLSNKTMGSTNTLTGVNMASITPDSGTHTLTFPTITDTIVTKTTTDTLTNKTLTSPAITAPTITGVGTMTTATNEVDVTDSTKQLAVSLSGATTSTKTTLTFAQTTNRTLTFPDSTDTMVGRTTTDTLTNKTLTSPTINSATLATPLFSSYSDFTEISTPANPSAGNLRVYSKSGDNLYILNSSGTETKIATGTPASYSRGDVATTTTITALSSSSSLIRLTGSTATNVQGIVAGVAGTILIVYNVSTALVSISHQNAGASAANRIITPSGVTVDLQPQWSAHFAYDDSQSRWILTAITSAQEWIQYTPTYSAGFGTVTNNVAYYKIIGDSLFIRGSCTIGTVAASLASISIPSGFTISSAKLPLGANTTSNNGSIAGIFQQANGANQAGCMVFCPGTSTSLVYFTPGWTTVNGLTAGNGSGIFTTGQVLTWNIEVPIV